MKNIKKYIDTETIKEYLNFNISQENYQYYKNYLDISLMLNNSFNFSNNRKKILSRQAESATSDKPIVKQAFDMRKIDQEEEYNPRRGLQNYNRSESYINESNKEKIDLLLKLNSVVEEIKSECSKEAAWQDSYSRVLHGIIEKTKNKISKSGDFTDAQPTMGSFDYIEELLYVRYRLSFENIKELSPFEIKKIILSKDSDLVYKTSASPSGEVIKEAEKPTDNGSMSGLIELLKALQDNDKVEKTITITIKA